MAKKSNGISSTTILSVVILALALTFGIGALGDLLNLRFSAVEILVGSVAILFLAWFFLPNKAFNTIKRRFGLK